MARFITRITTLCRAQAGDDGTLLRRFRMMRLAGDDEAGPGWFESSRELQCGLQVDEGCALEEWLTALRQFPPLPLPLPDAGAAAAA